LEARLPARADEAVQEELEALAPERLKSGESLKADDNYWTE
jgi:hypothetical protein